MVRLTTTLVMITFLFFMQHSPMMALTVLAVP